MAVAEVLLDVSRNYPDPFLQEMKLKTWKRSGRLLVLEQLDKVRNMNVILVMIVVDPEPE